MSAITYNDLLFLLGRAAEANACALEPTGTHGRCDACKQEVPLFRFRVEILTSSGSAWVWRTAYPHAHSRECFEEFGRRLHAALFDGSPPVDLWDRPALSV